MNSKIHKNSLIEKELDSFFCILLNMYSDHEIEAVLLSFQRIK